MQRVKIWWPFSCVVQVSIVFREFGQCLSCASCLLQNAVEIAINQMASLKKWNLAESQIWDRNYDYKNKTSKRTFCSPSIFGYAICACFSEYGASAVSSDTRWASSMVDVKSQDVSMSPSIVSVLVVPEVFSENSLDSRRVMCPVVSTSHQYSSSRSYLLCLEHSK